MKRSFSLLLLAFAVFAAEPEAKKAAAPSPSPALARIPVRMKEFVDRGQISGAVTLVATNGVVRSLQAVGWQDVEGKKPMRTDTIFQIMSMTKPFTGVGIMMLVEEGKLRITDPVEKHLPEFRGLMLAEKGPGGVRSAPKKPAHPITVFELMTHTSGMPTSPQGEIKGLLQDMNLTLAEAIKYYGKEPLEFEPGSKWQYSNTGLATLGRIIEVVSGQPYEKFIESRILRPLGMKDSFLFPPAEKYNRIAVLYRASKGKLERTGHETLGGESFRFRKGAKYAGPEYAMYSTATDLFAFYQMMLNGGTYKGKRLLSRSAVDLMTNVQTGDLKAGHNPGMGFGLTWEVVKDPIGSFALLSKGTFGHGGAFGTHGFIDKQKKMVGVFLIQSAGGVGTDAKYAFFAMSESAID
jgi:CubicO group peptidase (beta-lactamase class C family)